MPGQRPSIIQDTFSKKSILPQFSFSLVADDVWMVTCATSFMHQTNIWLRIYPGKSPKNTQWKFVNNCILLNPYKKSNFNIVHFQSVYEGWSISTWLFEFQPFQHENQHWFSHSLTEHCQNWAYFWLCMTPIESWQPGEFWNDSIWPRRKFNFMIWAMICSICTIFSEFGSIDHFLFID